MEPIVPQEDGPGPELAELDPAGEGARDPADNYAVEVTARSAPLAVA